MDSFCKSAIISINTSATLFSMSKINPGYALQSAFQRQHQNGAKISVFLPILAIL